MKHDINTHPSCRWPRHPVGSRCASYRERPFDPGEVFRWEDGRMT